MGQSYDLSIIIATHNAAPFLSDCLTSLLAQQDLKLQLIVVDNSSTDNTIELIESNFPQVILVKRQVDYGFSAANNLGLKRATAEYLLFLNPDTKFLHPTDLKKVLDQYLTRKDFGALTCRVDLALTGELDATCHRGFPTPWAALCHFSGLAKIFPKLPLFSGYFMSYLDDHTSHPVDAVGGMFLMVSRQKLISVGNWDEDYPLYGEDIDLCYRLHQAKLINYYWPNVTVLHYKGASTGMSRSSREVTTASTATTRRVKIWSIQAMELFYRKHYQDLYPFWVTWLVTLGIKLLKYRRTQMR